MVRPWNSTPASGSTPPVRRTTTATAGSCSTSCVRCGAPPPDEGRLMDLGLGGRGYLLTGASRGLGFATARALVDDGARVVVSARSAAAVEAAAKALADELGPRGIRVFRLMPGRIATDRIVEIDEASGDPEEARRRVEAAIPLRRYGRPEEFGRVAAFALSPAASYLTGLMIPVDGG